jgi:hypothetical protein
MPRRKRGVEEPPQFRFADLAAELAAELKQSRESGQPLIEEQHFPTGAVRVTVLWDKWDRVPQEDRSATILRAYELAESKESRDRIALSIGLTLPEAHASGLLPFQILPALRKGDPVTPAQCREAMLAEGASMLLDPDNPQLRLATEEDAQTCRQRLTKRLPGSEPVWVITREASRISDWSVPDLSS